MTALSDIRSAFLDHFRTRGHDVVPSAPLVPRNDPTLMFTNAGMVPFKNVFTGAEQRANPRAASAQKCVRAGGKHNDLDNVGYTARHHTFFEMLGNFSFGDYFKEEAILYAWQLVDGTFGMPKDRLLVTVYADDDEAASLWRKIAGFPDEKIIRIATSDNFWSMGDTGPCGPCSEIFFDYGPTVLGGPPGSADADGDRFVEFWNLVFMQFEQLPGGERIALPKPSIDTGMGLERCASILQGKTDNYDTDLFRRLIEASSDLTGQSAAGAHAASHRVIADHLRSSAFLVADGVLPANEGRGYVLRRIMRRAMRHAHLLGAKDPLMHRLFPVLLAEMGQAYPELGRAAALITETLRLEETRFRETLARGLKLLDEEVAGLGEGGTLLGETAFRLYDTYGFPLDLTQDALRARGLSVDTDGFQEAMARQKAEARKAWAGSGEAATDALWFQLRDTHGSTEFLGYETETAEGRVVAIVKDGAAVAQASAGDTIRLLTNQTSFYAESGGQVGDQGAFYNPHAEGRVLDVEKQAGGLHAHVVEIMRGTVSTGDVVDLRVDSLRRRSTRANHSATHLLHAALRRVLGAHVTQKGSLVAPERLRFDFSHPKPLTADEIGTIETIVNREILRNTDVSTRLMTPDAAIAAGALALFGEKYGEEVRVLSMGPEFEGGGDYSVELCGGTHVRRLGDIGLFKIVAESAVSSGVRRIEAVTGEGARAWAEEQARLLREAASALKAAPAELPERISALVEERRRLERELSEARRALALGGGAQAADPVETVAGLSFLQSVVSGVDAKDLKSLADDAKARVKSGIVAFIAPGEDGKASLVVGVTDDVAARVSAVDLVRTGVAVLGGKGGGGRADMAQGGGPDAAKAADALAAIRAEIERRVSA